MAALMEHAWPGNVRELKNVLRRAAALGGPLLEPEDLMFGSAAAPVDDDSVQLSGRSFEQIEREVLLRALRRSGGNQRAASQELGIPRSTLNDKLKRYGIEVGGGEKRARR
jgi:two-component system NtrC family response regulator